MTRLVIGRGSPDRGDDAVGRVGAAAVQDALVETGVDERGVPGVRVLTHEDPTGLLDLWADADLVVVVDAVRSGATPGTLVVLEAGPQSGALADRAWARTGRGGTHAFGLAAAVELARALHRLPGRLVLVGVEGEGFDHGEALSAPVVAAVPGAVRAVLEVVAPRVTGLDPRVAEVLHVPR